VPERLPSVSLSARIRALCLATFEDPSSENGIQCLNQGMLSPLLSVPLFLARPLHWPGLRSRETAI
jgi:hypothetical protein